MKQTSPDLALVLCGALALTAAVSSADPIVTGQWDFNYGDLRATVGADLEFVGDTATITTFPVTSINGQPAGVMSFGTNSIHQGFYMRHGAKPNGGGHFVNQYTLLMDVMFPSASSGKWRALFQTDPFNHDGTDAEFFVGDNATLPSPNGIGAEAQFNGTLAPGSWYRIAFAVDLTAPSGQQLTKYIDGQNVGSQSLSAGVDGRYALGPTALLFTAGDSSGGKTQAGYVNSIQFVDGCLTPTLIAALGGPAGSGLPAGNAAMQFTNISLGALDLTLSWAGPPGQFQIERATNLVTFAWEALGNSTTNHTLTVPLDTARAWYRLQQARSDIQVGPLPGGDQAIPSKQILHAAGQQVQFAGRPVDLCFSPSGHTVYIKNMNNLVVVDVASWTVIQTLNYPAAGASMHGIAASRDGSHVYVTGANNELYDGAVATNGTVRFSRKIALPVGSPYPCGLAVSQDGQTAYVCLSVDNQLAVVSLTNGVVRRTIKLGIAPWDIALSADGNTAYVSDWGGRVPGTNDPVALSAGSRVVVDSRGVAASGVVSFVDLVGGVETAEVVTGLHPSDLELGPDGGTLYVANANSDTVTAIDTQSRSVKETILIRPDSSFAYGSAADGLAVSQDGRNLFVALGGNNAIAVVELPNSQHTNSLVEGFLPTDWYPGAVLSDSNSIYVVNVKGLGSSFNTTATNAWIVEAALGTANKIPIPSFDALSKFTAQVYEDGRIRQIRQTQQSARTGQLPVPVPARVGEPSVFQHVLYILKENKTYDQMFGDIPQANGAPSLCIYPQFVSPNHHALAQEYVLLDNYYCSGVNSADGHSWSTEANDTDHLEKSFGGFTRSYTFGDDPLTYSSTGFLWNNALQHGLSFRNYGEMDYAYPIPSASWLQIYADFTNQTHNIHYQQSIGIASLRPYSSTNVPGWNLGIPDVVRAAGFIKELNAAQISGVWPALQLLYLPNDHTGGSPSPQAQVADNDLSLGQVVEAVTKSVFATNTVIFVIEDDPQSGYDHVDGHRSLCLVISPYTKRHLVVSTFYNQPGVLHTMEQILGLPPMNQQDAMAPLMFDCFTNWPDFTPYTALTNNVPLAQGAVATAQPSPKERFWAKKLRKMDFSKPDRIDEDLFNRYIWFRIQGDVPYPARFAGAHGKGLKQLGLVFQPADDD